MQHQSKNKYVPEPGQLPRLPSGPSPDPFHSSRDFFGSSLDFGLPFSFLFSFSVKILIPRTDIK